MFEDLDGERLVGLRTALGLSQMDMAQLMEVSQPQLHRLERGYAIIPDEFVYRLKLVFYRFLRDVNSIRVGGMVSEERWAGVAQFWASYEGLYTEPYTLDIKF